MSRVINLHSPGKLRSQLMRTGAEVLRRLGQMNSIDDEARDMLAFLVFCFRRIDEGISESVVAWEKRDYWVKAEQFRIKWAWVHGAAHRLETLIRNESWDRLPALMMEFYPYFEDIKIVKYTRSPSLWHGAYRRLMNGQHE